MAPRVDNDGGTEDNSRDSRVNPMVARNNRPSIVDLELELKKKQLDTVKLEEKIKELTILNAALSSKENTGGRRANPNLKSAELPENVAANADQISKMGKKYCVYVSPWLPPAVFKRSCPVDVDLTGTARYLSADTREDAIVAELYQFIPKDFHPALGKLGKFADLFRGGMSAMRSTALYTLRPHCSVIFDSLDPKVFKSVFDKKEDEELKRLVGWDKKSEKYTYWAPILFADPNAKLNLRYAFRNSSLALILRVILFGASSLSSTRRSTPKTNGQLWGVTSVNDSAIAFSAILSRFILSGDLEFVEVGNHTKIDYLADFWSYRQFLASVADAPHDALIKWYNKRVFIDKVTNAASTAQDSDENDKIRDDDIAAFNLGVDDGEEMDESRNEEVIEIGDESGDEVRDDGEDRDGGEDDRDGGEDDRDGDEDDRDGGEDDRDVVADELIRRSVQSAFTRPAPSSTVARQPSPTPPSSTAATRHQSPAIVEHSLSRHASPRVSNVIPNNGVIDEEHFDEEPPVPLVSHVEAQENSKKQKVSKTRKNSKDVVESTGDVDGNTGVRKSAKKAASQRTALPTQRTRKRVIQEEEEEESVQSQ